MGSQNAETWKCRSHKTLLARKRGRWNQGMPTCETVEMPKPNIAFSTETWKHGSRVTPKRESVDVLKP
jgi:hypothetical protein